MLRTEHGLLTYYSVTYLLTFTEIRSKDYLIVCDVKCPIKCFDVFLVIFLSFGPQRREYSVFDQALIDILLYTPC